MKENVDSSKASKGKGSGSKIPCDDFFIQWLLSVLRYVAPIDFGGAVEKVIRFKRKERATAAR